MLQTGDRVRFIGDKKSNSMITRFPSYDGCTGTIVGIAKDTAVIGKYGQLDDVCFYVRWDNVLRGGHSCEGLCEESHGWCCFGSVLEFVDEKQYTRYDIAKMRAAE